MLEKGGHDGASHGGENEKDGETKIVFQEGCEVVVVEKDEEECSDGDEGNEGGGVEDRA